MPTSKEIILWTRGVSYDSVSSLQQPGYVKTAQNILFEIEGQQTLRPRFANINSSALAAAIHSIKKFRTILIACDGTNINTNADTGNFTQKYTSLSGDIISWRVYKNFIVGCNGTNFFLVDLNQNVYPAQPATPATAPTLADSTSGSGPNGNYMGYVSYLITWPNGHTYETGLSAASANCAVTDNAIAWTAIPLSPYAAWAGTAPTIHRKLYRGPGTGGTLGAIYYVTTLTNNTAETYTDSFTDAQLSAASASYVDDYVIHPTPKYIEFHYGRLFSINASNIHRLYYSEVASGDTAAENEVLMPLATLENNWDDLRTAGFEYVDPQGIYSWGVYIYIPLKNTWIKKKGNDPDTWAYAKTYAKYGIGAPYTVDYCTNPNGIIGVTNPEYGDPGIAIFNGQVSEIFSSPRLDYIFNTDMNLTYITQCRGRIAGKYYHLLYPGGAATTPNTHLCIDMRRFPDLRIANWTDLSGISIDTDSQGSKFYIGASTGYAKTKATSGTANILLETHDLIGGDVKLFHEQKTFSQLKYALNGTVTLAVYLDGTALTWPDDTTSQSLTGTGEAIKILKFPENAKAYKISLRLTGTDLQSITIYSPWELLFDVVI